MGCVNSTANVQQAQDYELGPVRNDQSAQASTRRTVLRQNIDPRIASMSRAPANGSQATASVPKRRTSLGSIVDGDKYYTTGPVQNTIEQMGPTSRQLQQHELVLREDGKLLEGNRVINGSEINYVMDGGGNVYTDAGNRLVYHTDFLKSGRVAAAGKISAVDGRITEINNESGHYHPNTKHTDQVIQELTERGLDMSMVERHEITITGKKIRYYKDPEGEWIRKHKEH